MRLRIDGNPAAMVPCDDEGCRLSGGVGRDLVRQARSGDTLFLETQAAPDGPWKTHQASLDGFDALFRRLLGEMKLLDLAGRWSLSCASHAGKKRCTVDQAGRAGPGRLWFTATSDGLVVVSWLEFPAEVRLRVDDGESIAMRCTEGNSACRIDGEAAARLLAEMGRGHRLRMELRNHWQLSATMDCDLAGFGALYRRAMSESATP